MVVSPLVVSDDGSSHTQCVERMIQKITKVSDIVFTAERREQYVRAQEKASKVRGEGLSKEDFGISNSASRHHFSILYFSWIPSYWRLGGGDSPRPFNIISGGLGGRYKYQVRICSVDAGIILALHCNFVFVIIVLIYLII